MDPIGPIPAPPALGGRDVTVGPGLLVNMFVQLLITVGGLYALFNLILAGYAFLSAGDDPKNIQNAWAKIYQTLIGLAFLVGSLTIAALIGLLLFNNPLALLYPVIPTL